MTSILWVDGDRANADLARRGLAADHISVELSPRVADALAQATASEIACAVVDLGVPDARGGQVVQRFAAVRPGLPLILLAPGDQVASAISAHREHVYDVCAKPLDLAVVQLAIRRAIECGQLRAELDRLRKHGGNGAHGANGQDGADGRALTLEQIERQHILRVVDSHRGNKAAAAAVLGVDRKTLYRKLLRYGSGG